ncbi:VOC family protein [Ammonicoccus fulvus]|uniref:VOC family protein n=1 Tax=Ammonicoccus fulvus TaxID=3138240 RepID=A0ABZ3FJH8_9ACTN
MITALHALIYSDDAAATRAFFKDVLRWPFISDQGESADPNDWLIFRSGPSELGVHPTVSVHESKEYRSPRHHSVSLMCDDLETTMAELAERGAEFNGETQNLGFGVGVNVKVPGADDILLYQAYYPPAY